MKATTFWSKKEDDDDNNTNINKQQNNEGEKAKGGWVLCNFFWILFCGGSFFFSLHFYQAQNVFFHQESSYYIQIKHNERFLPQNDKLSQSWCFLVFVIVLEE
jgi:hypothetical protein